MITFSARVILNLEAPVLDRFLSGISENENGNISVKIKML